MSDLNAENNFHDEMANALNTVESTLKNLEQMLAGVYLYFHGYKYYTSLFHERAKIVSLREDLKCLRSFLKRVQGISVDQKTVTDLVTDIVVVVAELLVFTNSCVTNRNFDREIFLKHSSKVADLVGRIQSVEGMNHCPVEMVKARKSIESTVVDLALLLFLPLSSHETEEISSLDKDINCLKSFLNRLQIISVEGASVTDFVIDIVNVLDELLVATNSYIIYKIFDIEGFLQHSLKVAHLVGKIQYVEGKNHFHGEMAKALNIVEFTLEDLELLLGLESNSPIRLRAKISSLYKQVNCLRIFLKRMQEIKLHHTTVSHLVSEIVLVVDELLVATDSYILSCVINGKISDTECFLKHSSKVAHLVGKIQSVMEMILNVHSGHVSAQVGKCSSASSSSQNASSIKEKIIVGFEEERKHLLDRLIGGWKQLEVIPIIGMAGIGKTSLANKLFNNPTTVAHFHVRAWTSVSQLYQKRKFLCDILSFIVSENDPVFALNEEDIGEKLYKCLRGKRYLIVIDDIWDIGAWSDSEMYFPKNEYGSRILVTSRVEDFASRTRLGGAPCFLPFLTQDKSWHLFQYIVFADNNIPEELIEIGGQIVAKCKGLPLAIVIIAGLLAKEEKTREMWSQVAENIGGSINNDLEQLMSTLALSYTHLPSSLKSCFLYLASFPEDCEIPVRRLVRSWISEGFVQKTAHESLEDVAEDYLRNLVSRSLLMIAKRRSDGGIKSCRIHDLLRDLCLKKAEEKRFVQLVCRCGSKATTFQPKFLLPNNSINSKGDQRLLSFYDCQYFHFYGSHFVNKNEVCTKGTLSVYRLIRVLDLRHIILYNFYEEILQLLHLKYLALWVDSMKDLPTAVFELWNLETFILDGEKGGRVTLSVDFLKMVKLRHLQSSRELVFNFPLRLPNRQPFELEDGKAVVLHNLHTLSQLCPSGSINYLLSRTPNLRKLGFHLTFSEKKEPFSFPDLSSLCQLRTLKFEYQTLGMVPFHIPHLHKFPSSLRKLTLLGSYVNWEEMKIIGMLPNLEVLKIKDNFFSGPLWKTSEDGFGCLRFLKLSHLDLRQWISSSSHFPRLQHLMLNGCLDLEEIPSEIGDILTLQTIEVYRSSAPTVESARQIQESQNSLGNHDFKVLIFDHFEEY